MVDPKGAKKSGVDKVDGKIKKRNKKRKSKLSKQISGKGFKVYYFH